MAMEVKLSTPHPVEEGAKAIAQRKLKIPPDWPYPAWQEAIGKAGRRWR